MMNTNDKQPTFAILGCILGTAVGDALGLPFEGLSRRRMTRFSSTDLSRHRFLFGRGMVSDDTDHTCLVGLALLESNSESELFARRLAIHLRRWLMAVPAGVGLATLRACLRLCAGFGPKRSGVLSAGNGPAMRSALLGVCAGHDTNRLVALVRESTRITHTDPKAEIGALAVAVAAYVASTSPSVDGTVLQATLNAAFAHAELPATTVAEFSELVNQAIASANDGDSTAKFSERFGRKGASGYMYHTAPAVLQTWLRHPEDFRAGVIEVITAGGDTDTTAAILGALIGARVGSAGIPPEWLTGLWEWPRSVAWMTALAEQLARMSYDEPHAVTGDTDSAGLAGTQLRTPGCPVAPKLRTAVWQLPIRNAVFTTAVIWHGLVRLIGGI